MQFELGHKEEVANVKMCLGDNAIDHKQSTLTLGLVRDQKASPNDKPHYCFDEMERSEEGKKQNHVTYDRVVRQMLNEFFDGKFSRTNPAPCKLSTLLRWSIFGSLHGTNATVEAFSFEECLNIKQDNIHQNLKKR